MEKNDKTLLATAITEVNSENQSQLACSRRDMIKGAIQIPVALMATSSFAAFLSSCGGGGGGAAAGGSSGGVSIANDPSNMYRLNYADYPQLQTAGGFLEVTIQATSGAKNIYVTRFDNSTAYSVSPTCTHTGCKIGTYSSAAQKYTCPCHGSQFSAAGAVLVGPAPSALTSYTTTVTGSFLELTVA